MEMCDEITKCYQALTNCMIGWQQEQRCLFVVGDKLPRVIAAKRLKFYNAIGKGDFLNEHERDVNPDDENIYIHFFPFVQNTMLYNSLEGPSTFDDSLMFEDIKNIKQPQFDLREYIKAVKWMYHNWLGVETNIFDLGFYRTLEYLLAHARDFNQPAKNLIKFHKDGTQEIKLNIDDEDLTDIVPGDTEYVKNLNKLITELLQEYDEIKYRRLNLNVTYLVLLISRRIVKSEQEFQKSLQCNKTHENYANLCPNPLDSRLPMLSDNNKHNFVCLQKKSFINLILYSYLHSKGKTTKIFRLTCINFMENYGMGLWKLFYDVAKLYNIEDYKLWDVMSNYQHCCQALFTLSDLAHTHNEFRSADPPKTYQLFPYCRLLDQYYHCDLSSQYTTNGVACYALSFLIDLKLGLTKSFARNAFWINRSQYQNLTEKGEQIARDIFSKMNMY